MTPSRRHRSPRIYYRPQDAEALLTEAKLVRLLTKDEPMPPEVQGAPTPPISRRPVWLMTAAIVLALTAIATFFVLRMPS